MSDLLGKWDQQYFEGRLSDEVLDLMKDVPHQTQEVQAFVERVFRFMHGAKFRAEDFSILLGWVMGYMPSRILPGAWGGIIPPITIEGRHEKIDQYFAKNPWQPLSPGSTLLDIGCGFPPHTSVDTARNFPEWMIIAADPSFGCYLLQDRHGNYACFGPDGLPRYFQPGRTDPVQWDKLYRDLNATRKRYVELFQKLSASQPKTDPNEFAKIEVDGESLTINPLREYERPNLSFMEGGIGTLDVRNLDAVRCMNVLIYFDSSFRQETLRWLPQILKPGGIFICGMNWVRSTNCRYSVYKNESGTMAPKEFAFSLDNVRTLSFISWYALHDDDYETCLQQKAVQTLRSDVRFCREFDSCLDRLLAENDLTPRRSDGYLGGVRQNMTPTEVQQAAESINEGLEKNGFVQAAVTVLNRNGYNSWQNCIGHIAFSHEAV